MSQFAPPPLTNWVANPNPTSTFPMKATIIMLSKTINFARQMLSEHLQSAYVHSPWTSTQMSLLQLSTYAYYCARCRSHTMLMCIQPSCGHFSCTSVARLHMVNKEHAHKCNPFFDPISISDVKKESIARSNSQFQVTRREGMLKVHTAVEVQLATRTCSIIVSPSYLKLRKLTLIGLMGFPFRYLWY